MKHIVRGVVLSNRPTPLHTSGDEYGSVSVNAVYLSGQKQKSMTLKMHHIIMLIRFRTRYKYDNLRQHTYIRT